MDNSYDDINMLKEVDVNRLTKIQREIVLSRLEGKSEVDIAVERGCSRQNISIALRGIIKKDLKKKGRYATFKETYNKKKENIVMNEGSCQKEDDKITFIYEQYLISEQDIIDIIKAAREGNVSIERISNINGFTKDLKIKTRNIEKILMFGNFAS